jgi:hypothetical protein
MKKHVLIAHPDKDMRRAIEDILDDVLGRKGHTLWSSGATSLREAERKADPSEPLNLVVSSLEIPEDDQPLEGAGEQHRHGLELVRSLRGARPGMAAIIITGHVDDEVFDSLRKEDVGLVREGAAFKDQLHAEITRYLSPHEPEERRRIDLEIALSPDEGSLWWFNEGGMDLGRGPLLVNRARLRDLVIDSRDIRIGGDSRLRNGHRGEDLQRLEEAPWERDLRNVGEALADELFQTAPANLKFRDKFHELKGQVGIENIRVRFRVEDTLHPIAVEALKRREEDQEAWMLKTAVYRCQAPHTADRREISRRGLFKDEQTRERPVNFLIIQADVPHEAIVRSDDLNLKLDVLPNVEEEVRAVQARLSSLRTQGEPIGEVCLIKRGLKENLILRNGVEEKASEDRSFKQLVEDVLREGAWHVLHYAGHTHYDFQEQVGYLFFPCGDGLESEKVDYFAWCLEKADTRFVFLSSCKGGQQDFIYHLSKVGVPAIMGFLWNVYDPNAKAYADAFYKHLFSKKERSLEYACLEAKKEMRARYVRNPIWASAVLVMQVGA